MNRAATLGFVALAVTVLLSACGGSTPTTPNRPTPPSSVTFVPDSSNPGTDAIALGLSSSTAATFTLVLRAADVTDLYGYGVDIIFDPAIIAFSSATAGTFFDGTDITVTTQVIEGPPGTLVIGQSRVGSVPGVSGGGTLVSLDFTSVAAGTTTLTTANAGAFDSTGAAMTTQFFAGTVRVPTVTSR